MKKDVNTWLLILVVVLSLFLVGVTVYYQNMYFEIEQHYQYTTNVVTTEYEQLSSDYADAQEKINTLETESEQLRNLLTAREQYIQRLRGQIEELGGTPPEQ
ncbi:MAG: hypothetical protein ACXQT1_00155 [Methermicoccaceae archaeon]